MIRAALSRIRALFQTRRLDRELREEVAAHLAMLEDEFRGNGMTPEEARLAARREFGGVAQTQEAYRDRRGVAWIETTLKDVRYALRGLRRAPAFTVAAVASLALGIGATAAVFSLFYGLMVRHLPVARPDELVSLHNAAFGNRIPYPLYEEIAQRTDLFSGVVAATGTETNLTDRGRGMSYERVSGNYFSVLGVAPAVGRLFTEADEQSGNPVTVLSYGLWQRRFGGYLGVVGKTLFGSSVVIGVAARDFLGVDLDRHPDVWHLAAADGGGIAMKSPERHWVKVLARRKPGISLKRVQAALDVIASRYVLEREYAQRPAVNVRAMVATERLEVREAGLGFSLVREQFGKPLTVLMAAVALLLLAACANVASLLLARGASRRREMAMRLSLGATRGRVIRQSLTESFVLAAAGGMLGALLAFWGRSCILRYLPAASRNPFDAPDLTALLFTLGVSVLSAALFGIVPALRSAAADLASALRGDAPPSGSRAGWARSTVVVAQVALSVTLVALAALFGSSLGELRTTARAFGNRNLIALTPYFMDGEEGARESRAVLAKLRSMPEVAFVAWGSSGTFMGGKSSGPVRIPESPTVAPTNVDMMRVSERYFEALGAPMVLGREFNPGDAAGKPDDVAIVNQAFVRRLLPGVANPIGRSFSYAAGSMGGKQTRIIGVALDIPHQGMRQGATPTVYRYSAHGGGTILIAAKSPAAVLAFLDRELDTKLVVVMANPQTLGDRIDDSIFQDRILAALSGFFGVLALLLAAVGLYGVVAYGVARRAREFGIRLALGADRATVVWLPMRNALALVAVGLALGLPLALAATRAAKAIVFGVSPWDPKLFLFTALALLSVGAIAAFLPARTAARLDPSAILREE
jgi:predicted permease